MAESDVKFCRRCETEKPRSEFYKNSKAKDGIYTYCKECCRADYKKYYQDNSHVKRAYYAQNKDRLIAGVRTWQALHSEHVSSVMRRWRSDNPDKLRAYWHRRRVLIDGNGGDHSDADIRAQLERQNGKCFYCHRKLNDYHVDHVTPICRGGSNGSENLVIACPPCNLSKGRKHPMEFAGILL